MCGQIVMVNKKHVAPCLASVMACMSCFDSSTTNRGYWMIPGYLFNGKLMLSLFSLGF